MLDPWRRLCLCIVVSSWVREALRGLHLMQGPWQRSCLSSTLLNRVQGLPKGLRLMPCSGVVTRC